MSESKREAVLQALKNLGCYNMTIGEVRQLEQEELEQYRCDILLSNEADLMQEANPRALRDRQSCQLLEKSQVPTTSNFLQVGFLQKYFQFQKTKNVPFTIVRKNTV